MTVTKLPLAELDWALDLLETRRTRIRPCAPRYWRPAPDARRLHGDFLRGLVAAGTVVPWRTEHGIAFACTRGDGSVLLDDVALAREDLWADEGEQLLRAAAAGQPCRLVAPVYEPERAAAASRLGLQVAETWWLHELVPDDAPDTERIPLDLPHEVAVEGAKLLVVDAPPVYAPGGYTPLLLEWSDAASVRRAEDRARELGAVLVAAPVLAGSEVATGVLAECGYRRHCEFYEGVIGPE